MSNPMHITETGKINHRNNNFLLFTLTIISFLLVISFLPTVRIEEVKLIESLSFWIFLLISLFSLKLSKKSLYRLTACFILFVVTDVIGNHVTTNAQSLRLVAMLVFISIIFIEVSSQIFFSREKTLNRVLGSLSLFLIIGIQWAIIYLFIETIQPNSFSGIQSEDNAIMFLNSIYFSFICITSVGFGDVLPISPVARIVVAIEGVTGLFYMAVVVSTLVSSTQFSTLKSNLASPKKN